MKILNKVLFSILFEIHSALIPKPMSGTRIFIEKMNEQMNIHTWD